MSNRRGRSLAIVAAMLIAAPQIWAQATSSLRGKITDSTGAIIPGAVVTISNPATGFTRQTTSDNTGDYQFPQIAPGSYDLKVEQAGFRVATQQGIVLQVNTPATASVVMEVGTANESVNVSSEIVALNTVDASTGNAFTELQVRQLPLQTRNVVELLSLQPGVTSTGEVLGAKRDQNNITLDGVDANDNQSAGIVGGNQTNGSGSGSVQTSSGFNSALPVPLDSVQEFRVTVSGEGAQQGRSSGGQVSLVTKSGSNSFHGSAYEYNRNTATAANDWFSNRAGVKRQPLVRNQFGASLGGRIIKDRLFFFGNWEKRIDASGTAQLRTVPSDTLRQGIISLKASDGSIQRLSAAEIKALDPLHLGASPDIMSLFAKYPQGNDPAAGADKGMNFSGYRFNAPFKENDNAYVAKMDFLVNSRQTVSVRGTLAGNSQDSILAQFPGQDPAARLLNNSRGLSGVYTAVLKPSLVNTLTAGITRVGLNQTGTTGYAYTLDSISSFQNYGGSARGFVRIAPTYNLLDDLNWNKGKHTITAGVNVRMVRNRKSSYTNAYPAYSFSRNTLLGLGGDITPILNSYLQQRSGNSSLTMSDPTNVVRGMGDLLGLVNQYSATYNFNIDGKSIPFGSPVARAFASNDAEFYVQDSYRLNPNLTLTYGVRYSLFGVPYEENGVQVRTTAGVDQYFAERVLASQTGTPGYKMPNASLTYDLAGPVNGKPGWYGLDKNNWAPRVALAYTPKADGMLGRLLGSTSVFRMGYALMYDHYGTDMITYLDSSGSPGLASSVTQPVNTDFTSATRYINGALPTMPTVAAGKYPYTPATIVGGFGSYLSISPDLVAPYSHVMNVSYGRQLPGSMTLEVGYLGRLGHKQLLQQDTFQPLTQFKDPQSGQTWAQAATVLRKLYDGGVTPAQVKANPAMAGSVAFIENMFPALTNLYIPGSATANYFDMVFRQNDGSQLDALNQVDRGPTKAFPNCIVKTGCNTFFPLQNAGNRTWMNAGNSSFHAMMVTLRKQFKSGLAYDFNYTWSHSIDTSSAAEGGAGNGGAVIQDAFNPGSFRGASDFDARHQINANVLYELPFGKNKWLLPNASNWMNQIVGGWQVSMLSRYRSGLPTTISYGGLYPTNYLTSALAILSPGVTMPANGPGYDQNNGPSIFRSTTASKSFIEQYPGGTGTRGIVRLAPFKNFDVAIAKAFAMPWEGHTVQFRAEAFNALNNVNFYNPSLSLASTSTFGEFQGAYPARVMQFALRYQF